jgi:hypothetical protein
VALAPTRVQAGKVFLENLFARQRQVNGLMHLIGNGGAAAVIPSCFETPHRDFGFSCLGELGEINLASP